MKSKLNSKLKALKLQLNNCVMCAIKAPWETAELFFAVRVVSNAANNGRETAIIAQRAFLAAQAKAEGRIGTRTFPKTAEGRL